MRRVIAFDPGGTTGWATYTDYEDEAVEKFACGQLGPEEHHNDLDILLGIQQTDDYTVVSESFDYRNAARPGLVLVSREYIGVMKRFVQERNLAPVVLQQAAYGKGFVSDANIKRLGLWHPGWGHAMDATRHLLAYMINGKKNDISPELRIRLLEAGWK